MRILEINKFYFAKGGADKHFLDLAKLLEANGNEVAVFSMQHSRNLPSKWSQYFLSTVGYTPDYSLIQKIKGFFRMFFPFEAKRKINKILDDFQPEIVHIHNIYHQLSPCILFEIKKRGVPIVMTVHDYKLVSPNYNLSLNGKIYDRCQNGKYYECFLDKCIKNSYFKSFLAMLEMYWHSSILKTYQKNIDLYISPSQFTKNILVERGVAERKIIVLPHFIVNHKNTTVLQQAGVKEKYALYSGRISKEKGIHNLIDIFEEIEGLKLHLAGEIEDNIQIKDKKNIKYLGYLGQDKLEGIVKESLFVISPSKLPETFGLIALEANALGKPFVGFKSGAYPEIIENGFNGYLAENKTEMKELCEKIKNGKILFDNEKIAKSARKKYGESDYLEKLMEIFRPLTKH